MLIDSIQVGPLQLPFQAWPMMMTPAYGGGEPLAPGFIGQTIGGLGSLLPWPAAPLMAPWGGQPVYLGGPWVSQPVPAPGALGGPWTPPAVVGSLPTTPASEQQALITLMQEVTVGPIRKLHDYLEAHSPQYSQLAPCVPVIQQATQAFSTHNYTQALSQIYQVYRYISALRASVPDLPGL